MTIARILSRAPGIVALVLLAAAGKSQNSLPVRHPEPITIQILDGKGGAPLAHVHVQMAAGYDDADLSHGLWRAEAITDGHGRASLPSSLRDFPLLAVWAAKHKLCEARGRSLDFSLDRVRHEGLSAPNHCGTAVVADTPGVLNVFAKAKAKDLSLPPASSAAKPPAP